MSTLKSWISGKAGLLFQTGHNLEEGTYYSDTGASGVSIPKLRIQQSVQEFEDDTHGTRRESMTLLIVPPDTADLNTDTGQVEINGKFWQVVEQVDQTILCDKYKIQAIDHNSISVFQVNVGRSGTGGTLGS